MKNHHQHLGFRHYRHQDPTLIQSSPDNLSCNLESTDQANHHYHNLMQLLHLMDNDLLYLGRHHYHYHRDIDPA